MNRHERRKQAVLERVALKDIDDGPIRHLTLPPLLVQRIQLLSQTIQGLYDPGDGIAGWLEGFQRDLDPESEVLIWERIARAFTQFMEGREPLLPDARRELLGIALTEELSCKHLSPADAQAFLDALRSV